jgi:nicotinate-nucleotide--dimethylbenzimidazole phosphoribosyltransferase
MPSESTPTLAEMRGLMATLPGPDLEAGTAAMLREGQLTKPAGSLGRLEELSAWLATWQGRHPPAVRHPSTAVFAANHGIVEQGVSAFPAEVTAQMRRSTRSAGPSTAISRSMRWRSRRRRPISRASRR